MLLGFEKKINVEGKNPVLFELTPSLENSVYPEQKLGGGGFNKYLTYLRKEIRIMGA